jgi:hypothetical protein
MRYVSVGVLFVLACGACGATGGTSTVVPSVDVTDPSSSDPTPTTSRPREDPWVAFAATILDASRALQAAVLGNPYDEKWQCADPKNDIRATDARAGKTFASKGNPEYLLTTLQGITLTSPVDPAARGDTNDPDEPAPRPAQKPRIVVRGNAFVFADSRVRWFEITTRSVSYSTGDGETQTLLKRLPGELRGAMTDLVTTLTSSCVLSFIDGADLAPLPIPQEKKESAIEMVEHNAAEVSHACEAAARASGPWDARVGRMTSAYRTGEGVATIDADLRIEQGRLCIGRATADTL